MMRSLEFETDPPPPSRWREGEIVVGLSLEFEIIDGGGNLVLL